MSGSCTRLLVLIALLAGPAAADTNEAAYERAYKHGLAEFEAQHWAAARTAFESAYAIDPQPRLLVNIGSTYRHAGDATHALAFYERFLAEAEPDDTDREEVGDLIAKLRATPAPTPKAVAPAQVTPTLRTVGWLTAAVGVGALVFGGIEGYVAFDAAGELRQHAANHDPWDPALQARLDSSRERAVIGSAGGAALVAVGVGLVLTHRIQEEHRGPADQSGKMITVAQDRGGWSVAYSSRF
jgi:tetratricopeptide (TPR) repeat protein